MEGVSFTIPYSEGSYHFQQNVSDGRIVRCEKSELVKSGENARKIVTDVKQVNEFLVRYLRACDITPSTDACNRYVIVVCLPQNRHMYPISWGNISYSNANPLRISTMVAKQFPEIITGLISKEVPFVTYQCTDE